MISVRLTVFVLAAESGGKQDRWARYMKGPKQFVEVMGKRLLSELYACVERTLIMMFIC